MPLRIDPDLTPRRLAPLLERLFELSAAKILDLEKTWRPRAGAPVFTVRGRYTARGWTEWTQGFQYGAALLQFDATGERRFLELGRRATLERLAPHLTHTGVHDHGFNNVSTYGNLLRLAREGRLAAGANEPELYALALRVSGAVQAARWTRLADGTGFIHSFNGPHSLFVDTLRTCRVLALAHQLGHALMGEQEARISLLRRLVEHAHNTARYNVYYGAGRDAWDVPGRVAHEAVFNVTSGVFRCPNSQQGWSPFSTWTRGLAWALCGFAELLEYLAAGGARLRRELAREFADRPDLTPARIEAAWRRAAVVTADFYLAHCCADGIPMWDTGAPNLHRLPADYLERPADPFNAWEPVDSSAAAIAAQGLWRLGNYLRARAAGRPVAEGPMAPSARPPAASGIRHPASGIRHPAPSLRSPVARYQAAALTIARTLFSEPYLSTHPKHQGLILHSVYHRPNGWDYVAPGQKVPNGESSMWGDYHARELALLLLRAARGAPYLKFYLD
jgi:hypothetical protein